ncbi:MAG TPA: DNA internalization-related competence protein ComEC/Rec2 [Steroidobacteraceae bacterium]|jgi:competence protein ComEC
MLRIGIAFLLGHCCIHGLTTLPAVWPWSVLLCIAFAVLLLLRAPAAIALLLGIAWAWANAAGRLAEDLPAALEGVDLVVRGHVASLTDNTAVDPQFEFDVSDALTSAPGSVRGPVPAPVPGRIRLAWYDNTAHPAVGEQWQFVVRLKRRSGFANPGGFDYEGQLFRNGIGATGYIRADARDIRLAPASAAYAVLRVRSWISQRLATAVGDEPMLGVLQGLAVGDTHSISADQWRVFGATGTTHLLAISGMHIGMIATLLAWAGGAIVHWPAAQRWRVNAMHGRVIGGLCGGIGYSMLAGLSVPTQRTLLMLCIYFAARWWRREVSVRQALGLALIGVLLFDPFAPLAAGAWLSFGAVAVILLGVSGRLATGGVLCGFSRVQFAVTIGLMPVLIGAFGSLSLIAPVANVLAIPFFTLLLVPLVLIGTLTATVFLPAGAVVLGFTARLLQWCWPVLQWFADLPLAIWHFPTIPPLLHGALVVGSLLFVLPGIWATRWAALLLCLPALGFRPASPAAGEFFLTLLDVGQGLSAVVRTRRHMRVYDTGPAFRTGRDTGELVVLPYLYSQGVRQIDTLMISHGDLDHRGGMMSVMRGIPVAQLLVGPSVRPVAAARMPSMVRRCERGQRWNWDGVEFVVLHPVEQVYASSNESSCVLRISSSGGSVLLTGDIQGGSEQALVRGGLAAVDIVVAPHHGSRTSSTSEFVDATRPRWTLFPVGYRNRWDFPKPDIVRRWRDSGAGILTTTDGGAIDVAFMAAGMQAPTQYRREHRHYWSAR